MLAENRTYATRRWPSAEHRVLPARLKNFRPTGRNSSRVGELEILGRRSRSFLTPRSRQRSVSRRREVAVFLIRTDAGTTSGRWNLGWQNDGRQNDPSAGNRRPERKMATTRSKFSAILRPYIKRMRSVDEPGQEGKAGQAFPGSSKGASPEGVPLLASCAVATPSNSRKDWPGIAGTCK